MIMIDGQRYYFHLNSMKISLILQQKFGDMPCPIQQQPTTTYLDSAFANRHKSWWH